jgi:hypothetical protein
MTQDLGRRDEVDIFQGEEKPKLEPKWLRNKQNIASCHDTQTPGQPLGKHEYKLNMAMGQSDTGNIRPV